MAKSPDSRKGKDPARPTRAKAAREPLAPIAPALEKLLNPGIAKGTAGVGSQTGLTGHEKPNRARGRLPGAARKKRSRRPDCSRPPTIRGTGARIFPPRIGRGSRRRARISSCGGRASPPRPRHPPPQGGREQTESGEGTSSPTGFAEAPQAQIHLRRRADRSLAGACARARARRRRGVVPRAAVRAAEARAPPVRARRHPVDGRHRHRASRWTSCCARAAPNSHGAVAWTPHRPPRPEKSEGGQRARHQVRLRAEGRPADRDQGAGRGRASATTARRCCSASPARARPSPWRR